ncbi:MAG: mannose-1-phosphate guanylyltransferase [Bacteroidetes bacterium]|nr:MAG: mannose-1-phosphate guanylyltransferase [Bacteroidota bacterium]
MTSELYYIEEKAGTNQDGLAWIGYITQSRTGKTVYFNNKAFQKYGRGAYFDIETGKGYWISRIKKNGEDRHQFGHGKVMIDRKAVSEYLAYRNLESLKPSQYTIVDIEEARSPADFYELENKK